MEKLTHSELHRLVGRPTPELQERVETTITEVIFNLQDKLGKSITPPAIEYDLKGRTAGWAIGGHTIRLNIDLLYTNTEQMLNQTVPHEVCHIAQHQLYPHSKSHGREWQHLMRLLGLTPNRCHQYEVQTQRKHDRPHTYKCTNPHCGYSYKITRGMHAKIKMGSKRVCGKCRGPLVELPEVQ